MRQPISSSRPISEPDIFAGRESRPLVIHQHANLVRDCVGDAAIVLIRDRSGGGGDQKIAAGQGGIDGGGGNSQGAPIDGGLGILLLLGAGYGAKKLYIARKEKNKTGPEDLA